jgi:NADPH-dependent 2,4-dienoyl-CoA reductase/sulfur reductase-like enzyme/rhodanese-related sulfurtransferase
MTAIFLTNVIFNSTLLVTIIDLRHSTSANEGGTSMKKILVVGGVAGGASAAARARRLDPSAQIIVFERGQHVSFSNCSLPYHLSGIVAHSESLIMMTPEKFKSQHDIEVRIRHEVIGIQRQDKKIVVKELDTGREYEESYDKLILAPGSKSVRSNNIDGVFGKNVFTLRNVTDIQAIKRYADEHDCQHVVVIGGGFIGVEIVENFRRAGKDVTLLEGNDQIMQPFDYEMAQWLHKEMFDQGVNLYLSSRVTAITEHSVTAKGQKEFTIPADLVVLSAGIAPDTTLAEAAGLDIGTTGAIKVNHNFQTNDPNIYAVGDAIETYSKLAQRPGHMAMAGPAQRQARAAVDHIYGIPVSNKGFIGSSCTRVFGLGACCTGLNEKTIKKLGIPYDFAYVLPMDKVKLMPDSHYMAFKLLFEVPTGRILGAQAIGQGNVDKRIDIIATMITMNGTLEDLKELELCYTPAMSTAKDIVNFAALVGLNILDGRYRQVPVTEVRRLVETGAFIVDVREENEYAQSHLKTAVNIPLSQLRQRMDEIPKDIPVYIHCRTSQRSYYAICCLQGHGYDNLYNICGSYLGISLYEYFNDKTTDREPIVTGYNFK